ncbi:CDP-alcohol phosphatidyltransferase family protein [Paenibacillus sp. SC116]|uniref:CDP-alcohol phosphatidyltransferase family protein n=1 Tax=Paenibacillus sp. SC116 TaxID=2968986 RepID=UPI00215B335B|nr:CDP-alcohol phosphatidyltransferase family protein [Paenibacillus sp. SC116]MCR8844555.1 CDP-alcohol phosphatidyltransferase family protein [Paenibacillus sp. SC116]
MKIRTYFPAMQFWNVPNLLTTLSVMTGFISIVLLFNDKLTGAFTSYAITILLDRLDGVVARRFEQSSTFGQQLDSLADVINFCLYPPLYVGLFYGFTTLWMLPFLLLFLMAGIWRLAYFNISGMQQVDQNVYFKGIPTTVCASWFLITFALLHISKLNLDIKLIILCLFFLLTAIFMVSAIPYPKNGFATKLLYVLVPGSVILVWL